MYKIFIDGQEGTTGLKIFDRFQKRRDIEILKIENEKRKCIDHRLAKMEEADITFLCLPDEASLEIIKRAPKDARILDTSTAHRTNKDWIYGFPELNQMQRQLIKTASRVAVPGCHASGFIALVNPLIALDLAPTDYPFSCHSITGYSGGGKKMIGAYESQPDSSGGELDSPRQYGLSQKHKHLKEMTAITGIAYEPIFHPIVSNFYSGMVVTVPVHTRLLKKKIRPQELREAFQSYYQGNPMVKVRDAHEEPGSGFVGANHLSGANQMELFLFGNEDRITLMARFDNLGKGASGVAIQCMNLMLGLPEETGL